ncbi:MAG: OmpW family outer membrane protein [Rickettsiales bacterium]
MLRNFTRATTNVCGAVFSLAALLTSARTAHAQEDYSSSQHVNSPYFQRPYMWSEDEGKLVTRARLGAFLTRTSFPDMQVPSEANDFDGKFVTSSVMLDFDGSYRVGEHFTLSASLGYVPQESMSVKYMPDDSKDSGRFHMMPMSVSMEFYPFPYGAIRPYVGGGAYVAPVVMGYDRIDIDSPWGWMAHAGFDWWVKEDWGVSFDVKYYAMEADVDLSKFDNVANGPFDGKGKIAFDPVVVGLGLSYRFPN